MSSEKIQNKMICQKLKKICKEREVEWPKKEKERIKAELTRTSKTDSQIFSSFFIKIDSK